VPGNHTVSQVVTVNFDELDSAAGCYVELFVGSALDSLQYGLSVLTYPGGAPVSASALARGNVDHKWVRFYLNIAYPESIVRGRKLEFRFTRVFPDPLQFYYDTTAGYSRYGQMIAPPGQSPIPATAGLAGKRGTLPQFPV